MEALSQDPIPKPSPPPITPDKGTKKEAEQERPSSKPDNAEPTGSQQSSATRVPYATEMTEVEQELMRRGIEGLAPTAPIAAPPPDIANQIEIVNSVMETGLLTKLRAQKLGIPIIQSADRNQEVSNKLCLNYIHSDGGKKTSLYHPAKGGLPVVLERKNDPLERTAIDTPVLLSELSERAHHSMLFVIKCDRVGPDDAELKLIDTDGEEFMDKRIYPRKRS